MTMAASFAIFAAHSSASRIRHAALACPHCASPASVAIRSRLADSEIESGDAYVLVYRPQDRARPEVRAFRLKHNAGKGEAQEDIRRRHVRLVPIIEYVSAVGLVVVERELAA